MENSKYIIGIDERDINSGRIMEMTPECIALPETVITVPSNYRAEIVCEDKVIKTLKTGIKKKLLHTVGSEYEHKSVSALYVTNRKFTSMSWGIGSLRIKYDFLGGCSVNVGANGTLIADITDPLAFYRSFGKGADTLDITECAGKITSAFRVCASQVLVDMFNEAIQPIFDTEFLVSEMDRRLNERYCNVPVDNIISGIVFKSATVSGIRVNESDKNSLIQRFGVDITKND